MDLAQIREDLRRRSVSEAAPKARWSIRRIVGFLLIATLALPVLTLVGFRTAAALRETENASDLAPRHGRFVATRSGRMFLQEKGPSSGIPVVLIHGTGAWSELWRDTIDHLAERGFRVIALDMPPFGFSDRPQPPSYTRAAQAERIKDALDGLGIDNAYLVGHSFGAGPTVETVLRYPGKARGLVLVAGALGVSDGGNSADPSGLIGWLLNQDALRNGLVALSATNPLMTRQLLSMMIHRKERADARAVAILQRPMTLQRSTPDMGAWLKYFLSVDRAALSADRRRYANIKVKTTLIWGDRDTLTPLAQGQDIHGLIQGSRLTVIPDIGHIPQVEDPGTFGKVLSDALIKMSTQ
jgi:pimeloyl-ACP methyl ester carboxylesterase